MVIDVITSLTNTVRVELYDEYFVGMIFIRPKTQMSQDKH
jgi:hypothetical protein